MSARNKDSQLIQDLIRFKAPDDIIESAIEECSPVVEIWPENYDVFQFFLRLSSQWVVLPTMSRVFRTGLKYESVEALMRIEDMPNRVALFRDLQVMEFAALECFNGGGE